MIGEFTALIQGAASSEEAAAMILCQLEKLALATSSDGWFQYDEIWLSFPQKEKDRIMQKQQLIAERRK